MGSSTISEEPRTRPRSYSFGWSPGLGGFPKFPSVSQGAMNETPAQPLAIPQTRSASISSASDSSVEDCSFRDSSFTSFPRRNSVGIPSSPMFQRRPSIDEERILKGEFSF